MRYMSSQKQLIRALKTKDSTPISLYHFLSFTPHPAPSTVEGICELVPKVTCALGICGELLQLFVLKFLCVPAGIISHNLPRTHQLPLVDYQSL